MDNYCAYIVSKDVYKRQDGTLIPHGWVAMRVDDSTYYIDPTYVCQTGEMDNLKMKNEMERIDVYKRQALSCSGIPLAKS